MKSMGLAITIFALTGALAALDLSGVHAVQPTEQAAAKTASPVRQFSTAVVSKAEQQKLDDDDGDGELVRTFLLTPKQLPATTTETGALRYD